MTDRVEYVDWDEKPLETVESSIVPEKDSLVGINDDVYQVYGTAHLTDGEDHTVTVFCRQVDDLREEIGPMIENTLRAQQERREMWDGD